MLCEPSLTSRAPVSPLLTCVRPSPDRIAERLAEIQQLWSSLEEAARAKGAKLAEASEQQQFNRGLEDMDLWMSELEGQLMSEDYGKVRHRA